LILIVILVRAEDLLVWVIRLAIDVQCWRILRSAPRDYPTRRL